jgi:hypothetical protein
MPRFVILEHDYPQLHYDLMLESGDVLWTWRLACPPQIGDQQDAERVFDHRLLYLDYEGPISGNRGTVRRRDHGTLVWQRRENALIEVRLEGVMGHLEIRLMQGQEGQWRLQCSS